MGTNDGSVTEAVLQLPTLAAAERIVRDQRSLPAACGAVGAGHRQTVAQPVPVAAAGADEALAWTVDDEPPAGAPAVQRHFDAVGLATSGNVVVVLTFTAAEDPTSGAWADYAARTLGLALGRALG